MEDYEYYDKRAKERIARRKKQRIKQRRQHIAAMAIMAFSLVVIILLMVHSINEKKAKEAIANQPTKMKYISEEPELDVQLLDINKYSRPGIAIGQVNGIVVHYTANPGTSAQQNRDYFQGLSNTGETFASSHFVIGLEGEIVQCIPCNEMSYASNDRNKDTISIECCIEEEDGRFNVKTYGSLVKLTTWLMGRYGLTEDAVIRHYDVTGKNCPKYFVENQSAWDNFKEDLVEYIDEHGTEIEDTVAGDPSSDD